jgi:methyltransferase (TIGR00027 family)
VEARKPSLTMVRTALWRAVHRLRDQDPKILDDPFAGFLAGFDTDEAVLEAHDASDAARIPGVRTPFVVRNRYAEDELTNAVEKGVGQYVILGAGLDSFAYRRTDLMQSLVVYEVDQPASQAWKQQRLAQLQLPVPAGLKHVPVDFETQTLSTELTHAGFRRNAPAFFSWLGTTQYLTREAILSTIGEVANLAAPGSEIVVQFIAPLSTIPEAEAAIANALAERSARSGEPWLSYFTPAGMEEIFRQVGCKVIEHFGAVEATSRYLQGRTDGSRVAAYFGMVKAVM